MKKLMELLEKNNACSEGIDWIKNNNIKSPQEMWDRLDRGNWMLWYMDKINMDVSQGSDLHRQIVLMSCEISRLSLPNAGKRKKELIDIIETLEGWARREQGKTFEMVKKSAARSAAWSVESAASSAASSAAWSVESAARSAARSARSAARSARSAARKKQANIIRKYFPEIPNATQP